MKTIVIIDGNSLVNRAFYAIRQLTTKKGFNTNAIYGFVNILYKIIDLYNPEYMAVAFDRKAPTFRHQAYDQYKAGRKGMPEELREQMPVLKEILSAMNIKQYEIDGFEADDIIGTIAREAEAEGLNPYIITGDRDAQQLATDKTHIIITKKGITEFEEYDTQGIIEKYGIEPKQLIDLKALMGDQSDNIPGIPGVGEKTGLKLIKEFGSLEGLIANYETIENAKLKSKVEENIQLAIMSRKLAEINVHVPISFELSACEMVEPDYSELSQLYTDLELHRLLDRIKDKAETSEAMEINIDKTIISTGLALFKAEENPIEKALLLAKEQDKPVIIKVFGNKNHVEKPTIDGVSLLVNHHYFYVNTTDIKDLEVLCHSFNTHKPKFISHDLKEAFYSLAFYGLTEFNPYFDTCLAQYLISPERNQYELDQLLLEYFNLSMMDEKGFAKEVAQLDFTQDDHGNYESYGLLWTSAVEKLIPILEDQLKEKNLTPLFYDLELPLISALTDLEIEGITVDVDQLKAIGDQLKTQLDALTKSIYEEAGEEFNINSPKQLGVILFEKLELKGGKKTKTGYSTNIEVLNKLSGHHPMIDSIIEYRSLNKLNGTYIEGLLPLINKEDHKIRAHFNQMVTATGRISCTEPNLQNIPIKQEIGRQLRKVFVPADDTYTLVGADYSQIELRVLGELSGDEALKEAFIHHEDIHTITASNIFNVAKEDITLAQRSSAKAINFGVIYGMSDWGLSGNLHISKKEAAQYIEAYFQKHQKVKSYMDGLIEGAKEKGYVETLLGRRRSIPEIHAKNFMVRNLGERLAMNSPIQGTAADIIKLAMLKVNAALEAGNFQSKLILQVHDELIIHTKKEELEDIKVLLEKNMVEALTLSVPLEVSLSVGDSWYDLK